MGKKGGGKHSRVSALSLGPRRQSQQLTRVDSSFANHLLLIILSSRPCWCVRVCFELFSSSCKHPKCETINTFGNPLSTCFQPHLGCCLSFNTSFSLLTKQFITRRCFPQLERQSSPEEKSYMPGHKGTSIFSLDSHSQGIVTNNRPVKHRAITSNQG